MSYSVDFVIPNKGKETFKFEEAKSAVIRAPPLDEVLKSFKDGPIRSIYYPSKLYEPGEVITLFNTLMPKLCNTIATEKDIQKFATLPFMVGDNVIYPSDLITEVITKSPFTDILKLFKLECVDPVAQQMSVDQETETSPPQNTGLSPSTNINWSTLIYKYSGTGELISQVSAAHTILSWMFTQLRLCGKSADYISNITASSSLVITPSRLNPSISVKFLLELFKTYSVNPDVMKYFRRASTITANLAYMLMMRNVPGFVAIPTFNFWSVSVKYHEMAAYNLYFNALTTWNKTDLDMIQIYYTPDALQFYKAVHNRVKEITTAPYFYTFASWFIETYLAEFSLRKFPEFAYTCWCLYQKARSKPDSSNIPGLKLHPKQEDYQWEIAEEIMENWSVPQQTVTGLVIKKGEEVLPTIPMRSIQEPFKNHKRLHPMDEDAYEIQEIPEEGLHKRPKLVETEMTAIPYASID